MEHLQRAKRRRGRFLNPVPTTVGGFGMIFKVLPLYFSNRAETEPKQALGPFRTDVRVYRTPPESGLRVTWFGHSSMLVEIDGVRVLVDPVWEQRASPVEWFGPQRFFAPTMRLEDLPELDAILISHDHYDHLGAGTVRGLAGMKAAARAMWVTSLGVGRRLRGFGVPAGRIAELDWTQSVEVAGAEPGQSMQITAWPARHFSGRTPWDRFRTLWSSFVLEGPRHRVYFGADSGWWEGFAAIAERYERFDLTMLEIGAFHPLWAEIHLGPDGAARAYEAMGGLAKAGPLMPIHWGMFNLALHGWRQPIDRLEKVAQGDGLVLWTPEPGVPTEVVRGRTTGSRWWDVK
ncbi:MAG TPA: MBL fold metallo-hydrolase [Acidobacteriaceae bacterium]|jgi:L-ascorbate metabolism protein UlaG (beta-lactamase superfamily)|nr:MBL fold metallo-hydrolase [Acidobacteriaceae bacterium]